MIKNSRITLQSCRKKIFLKHFLAVIFLFSISWSCKQANVKKEQEKISFRKDIPYTKTYIKYARGFSIDYFKTYKIINVFNKTLKKTDTLKYVLVQRGYPIPHGFKKHQIIPIPVRKMIGMSSLQIAMADFTESADILVGLGSLNYVTSKQVRNNIKEGKVVQVGEEGTLNKEGVIALNPDLLMGMGNPSADFSRYQTLLDAGIPVLLNSEWLENTPLGRAEWVKLMAALVNKEALVNTKFNSIEKEYTRLAQLGSKASIKPSIIVGMPFKGSWFVPDGTSFMTQFFKDAGATYAWTGIKGTGSMGLSFESVAPHALKADYWINSGIAHTKKEIADMDIRYTYFKPYKTNTIYNFNKKVNDIGSNDYWESGVVNPHIVLADLIKIMHPKLLPKHQLVYYKQIL